MKAGATVANEESTAAEDVLRHIVDTTPALIHTGRPEGHLDYFNRGWLDLLGCSLDEVCGWRWTNFIHRDDAAGIVQKWHAALDSGEPFEAEARVRRANGDYRLFLHRKVPMRDERGTIIKWLGSSIDIEDSKQIEDALRAREQVFGGSSIAFPVLSILRRRMANLNSSTAKFWNISVRRVTN